MKLQNILLSALPMSLAHASAKSDHTVDPVAVQQFSSCANRVRTCIDDRKVFSPFVVTTRVRLRPSYSKQLADFNKNEHLFPDGNEDTFINSRENVQNMNAFCKDIYEKCLDNVSKDITEMRVNTMLGTVVFSQAIHNIFIADRR